MNKIFSRIVLLCMVSVSVSAMEHQIEQNDRKPFVIRFEQRPDEDVREKIKEIGFLWWNHHSKEWAGLCNEEEVKIAAISFKKQFDTKKMPNDMKVLEFNYPAFLLRFEEKPEKGKLRKVIENFNFGWWNQHNHEWFGLPKENKETIESIIRKQTQKQFHLIDLEDGKNFKSLTGSTKASSDDSDNEQSLTSKLEFLKVEDYSRLTEEQAEESTAQKSIFNKSLSDSEGEDEDQEAIALYEKGMQLLGQAEETESVQEKEEIQKEAQSNFEKAAKLGYCLAQSEYANFLKGEDWLKWKVIAAYNGSYDDAAFLEKVNPRIINIIEKDGAKDAYEWILREKDNSIEFKKDSNKRVETFLKRLNNQ